MILSFLKKTSNSMKATDKKLPSHYKVSGRKNKPADDMLLNSYKSTAEALGFYLGPAYEIVLYDLRNPVFSIIKIINGEHSGKKAHHSLTAEILSVVETLKKDKNRHYHCFSSINKRHKRLYSAVILISGSGGETIGLLCINLYYNSPISDFIHLFNFTELKTEETEETFSEQPDNQLLKILREVGDKVYFNQAIRNSQKNKEIIRMLYDFGIFKMKKAIDIVSAELGVAKSTIYLHLNNIEKEHPGS